MTLTHIRPTSVPLCPDVYLHTNTQSCLETKDSNGPTKPLAQRHWHGSIGWTSMGQMCNSIAHARVAQRSTRNLRPLRYRFSSILVCLVCSIKWWNSVWLESSLSVQYTDIYICLHMDMCTLWHCVCSLGEFLGFNIVLIFFSFAASRVRALWILHFCVCVCVC